MSNSSGSSVRKALPDGHDLIQTVLLVDSPHITGPVGNFLRQTGWTVHEASNCGQARGLVARYKPEFVIMELLLPLETGFEFCAFLKKADCRTAVMIFTEVHLDEARNLAMWAGADAFLAKPTDPNHLYFQILKTAQRVSFRIQKAEVGMGGSISFRCRCGKQLKVGSQHAGRAVVCPGCRSLAKCPESMLDSGTLYRSLMEERRGLRSSLTGIECPGCHKIVDPRKCRVRDHDECYCCQRQLKVSADFLEQWLLFFGDQRPDVPVTDFNPLRYMFVQCEKCRSLHQYFRDADTPLPCSCGHQHSLPSILGVPISRAALTSTGRLFEFRLTDGRNKLFLLPSRRKWIVGSASSCALALPDQPLQPQHCYLRNTPDGPTLMPLDPTGKTTVNGKSVASLTLLKPGDQIQLGSVQLSLHGTPERQLRRQLYSVLNEVAEHQKIDGELQLAEPAARILQHHWELQRLRWIEHRRNHASPASSESSTLHQIIGEHLH